MQGRFNTEPIAHALREAYREGERQRDIAWAQMLGLSVDDPLLDEPERLHEHFKARVREGERRAVERMSLRCNKLRVADMRETWRRASEVMRERAVAEARAEERAATPRPELGKDLFCEGAVQAAREIARQIGGLPLEEEAG